MTDTRVKIIATNGETTVVEHGGKKFSVPSLALRPQYQTVIDDDVLKAAQPVLGWGEFLTKTLTARMPDIAKRISDLLDGANAERLDATWNNAIGDIVIATLVGVNKEQK